jgi:signal peptidase I
MSALNHHQTVAELIRFDLKAGERIRFAVTSNSMQPILNAGEFAIAEAISSEHIQCGDILVVQRKADFLTHRAISRTKRGWQTKGDNNSLPDPPTTTQNIIGHVIAVEKADRKIDLCERKWMYIGTLLAKLGKIETRAFLLHRYFRYPFRIAIKVLQKTLIIRMIS